MARKPAPLVETIIDTVGVDIAAGRVPVGTSFTLQDLSDRFDISRTVAREVMRALEQRHVVTSSRRVGLTVLPERAWAAFDDKVISWRLRSQRTHREQLRSLTELRIAIEPMAAFLLASSAERHNHAEHLTKLAARLRELGENGQGNSVEFLQVDIDFHSVILENCGNKMFAALAPTMAMVMIGRTELGLQPRYPAAIALTLHEELAAAIAEGNSHGAEAAAQELLKEVRDAVSNDNAPLMDDQAPFS